jgi:membrane associated rhomboid family serine protease
VIRRAALAHQLTSHHSVLSSPVLPLLVFIAVVCGLVLRRMTQEERIQLFRRIIESTPRIAAAARQFVMRVMRTPAGCEEFYVALRSRTRWAIVTPAIVAAWLATQLLMWWNGGDTGDRLLVEWGASVGPLTTNAEWTRVASAMFIHRGWFHLIADTAGLLMAGALIERVVGRATFMTVFAGAGLLTGLLNLEAHPVSVLAGGAGAVFGVFGLMAATMVWGFAQRSPLTIPVAALRRVWPGAAVFVIHHLATEGFGSESMRGGLFVGLAGGLILVARVSAAKPPLGRVCATTVATMALFVAFAIPLRGIADVPAAIARVVDVEERTAALYDEKADRFKKGRMTAEQLASVADEIRDDVRQSRVTLASLTNVPVAHGPLWKETSEFLRLREESWRLRVTALREGRMQTLHQASVKEFEAMRVFDNVEKLRGG